MVKKNPNPLGSTKLFCYDDKVQNPIRQATTNNITLGFQKFGSTKIKRRTRPNSLIH